jgi:hypothetical protein
VSNKLLSKSTFLTCTKLDRGSKATPRSIAKALKPIRPESVQLSGYPEIPQRVVRVVTFRIPAAKVAGIPQQYATTTLAVVAVRGASRWLLLPDTATFYRAHPGSTQCGF